jgi:hypothetical protein
MVKMSKPIGERLTSLPKHWLYGILLVVTTVPLFATIPVPNEPVEPTIDLYASLMKLPDNSRVLFASDWTGSTRGESMGQFDSIMKILMSKHIKVVLFSTADPQAPQAARDAIENINQERKKNGEKPYDRWTDWVNVGYFPNSEAAINGIANDLRAAFTGRKDFPPGEGQRDIFQSPVLQGAKSVQDFPMLITVTASKTSNYTVERVSGKTPLAFAVTGVMSPETQVFYQAKQIVGFAGGLKGEYDLETLMMNGVNVPGPDGKPVVKSDKYDVIPKFPGKLSAGKGATYYPTLHFAIALMIIMVVIGNVGMFLTKRGDSK